MTNLMSISKVGQRVSDITEDGAYLVQTDGIVNYGERWAYGYIVPIRILKTSDVKRGTIFLVANDEVAGDREFLFANHIDDPQTARRVARDSGQKMIYDLREQKWATP